MKRCFKCRRRKPIRLFYKHQQMGDGRLGKCKHCAKRDVRRAYYKNHAARAAYERRRFNTPERRRAVLESQRRQRARFPGKYRARQAVSRAIRDGRLKRGPCERCGTHRVQAHHDDYRRPLHVRWVCFRCHREQEHGQRTATS